MKDTDIETKIDDLVHMVADGFTECGEKFKAIRAEMVAQDDVAELRAAFKAEMARLRGDLDIMLDKHIGVFRKDFDELGRDPGSARPPPNHAQRPLRPTPGGQRRVPSDLAADRNGMLADPINLIERYLIIPPIV